MYRELIFLFPFIGFGLTQLTKFFIKSNKFKLTWKYIFAYSGMPSSHSSLVVGTTAAMGFYDGFSSGLFVLSLVITIIVISDALHLRNYMAKQGKVTNSLIKDLDDDEYLDGKYPKLLEHIGHTPAQIVVGSLIGLVVNIIGAFLILF